MTNTLELEISSFSLMYQLSLLRAELYAFGTTCFGPFCPLFSSLLCSFRILDPKGRSCQESAVCVLCEWHDECGDLTQQQAIETEFFLLNDFYIRFDSSELDRQVIIRSSLDFTVWLR